MDNTHSEQESSKLRLSDLKKIHKTTTDIASSILENTETPQDSNSSTPAWEKRKFIKKIWNKLIPGEKKHKEELTQAISEGEIDRKTQVLNERGFTRRWIEEISRLRRAEKDGKNITSVILYIDANMLKQVNDEKGHDAGDEYLKNLTLALNESIRPTDTVGRIGGDEFAIILRDTALPSVREIFETRIKPQLLAKSVSVSIGADYINPHNPDESKEHADQAMYDAKKISKASYGTIEYKEYGENIK